MNPDDSFNHLQDSCSPGGAAAYLSDRYENVVVPVHLVTEACDSSYACTSKTKSKKLAKSRSADQENSVKVADCDLKRDDKRKSEDGKLVESKGGSKNTRPLPSLLNYMGEQKFESVKKKQHKHRSHDKRKYVQQTLSPYILKQKNPS